MINKKAISKIQINNKLVKLLNMYLCGQETGMHTLYVILWHL